MQPLATERLRLIPATSDILDADLALQLHGTDAALRHELGVGEVAEWPPADSGHDPGAIEFFRSRLVDDPAAGGWYAYYVCLGNELVGSAGFFGPPVDGGVEIGYSICSAHRRKGIALEAVDALVRRAHDTALSFVLARTLPDNGASIALLRKAGFTEESPADGHRIFRKPLGGR